ncbi:MAG: M48 family metalloprotease [Cyanobacteria bacterium P01_A01_bin.37]
MGFNMRLMWLVLGGVPSCLIGLVPRAAIADPADVRYHEGIIGTAEMLSTQVLGESQATTLPASPPPFRVERDSTTIPPFAAIGFHDMDLFLTDYPVSSRSESIQAQRDPSDSATQPSADPVDGAESGAESSDDSVDGAATTPHDELESPPADVDQSDATSSDAPSAESDVDAIEESAESDDAGVEASDSDAEGSDIEAATHEGEEEISAEVAHWQQLLMEGDRFFLQGDYLAAEQRYQEAKDPENEDADPIDRPEAYVDPDLLPPAGRVYWREYQTGLETGLETRIYIPLGLLAEEYPEFIPGQVEYALLLSESDDEEAKQKAIERLEQGTALFPDNAELARARVDFLAQEEQWLQAAIAARQFTILNPEAPELPDFQVDADEYQRRFRSRLRGRLTRNAIGSALTGALGVALTGNPFGAFSAIETTVLMLRGESAVGRSIANQAVEELDLIEDDEVVAYVNEIGQELASLSGRDEFEYEFYVVEESDLNAFALPGGKVFVNAGAILKANTEAEFAGLLAHELAHAVLSHGFQLVTRGNLTANVLQFVPYGGYVTNLAVLSYSRSMERQADALGTQLLSNSDYAADGLHRLMITLNEESDRRSLFDWLSTHPDTPERIRNIDRLIDNNGYNRYAFEGIERHLHIQERVEQLLREADKLDDDDDFRIDDNTDAEDPQTEESPSEDPPIEESLTDEPTTEESPDEELSTEESTTEEPLIEESTTEDSTTEDSPME